MSLTANGWSDASKYYNDKTIAITVPFAAKVITAVNELSPLSNNSVVLDNGCGPGPLTVTLKNQYSNLPILAADFSSGMLAKLSALNLPGVKTLQVDAMDLGALLQDCQPHFTHVFSNFMNQFTPAPFQPINEMIKALEPGGVLGISSWGSGVTQKVIPLCAQKSYPDFQDPGSWATKLFPENIEDLERMYQKFGLEDVKVRLDRAVFSYQSVKGLDEFIFGSRNPGLLKQLDALEAHAGKAGVQKVREHLPTVVQEQGWDLSICSTEVFIAVGRKPNDWKSEFDPAKWSEGAW